MHGGMPNMEKLRNFSFDEIKNLQRPIAVVEEGAEREQIIVSDLLWADPAMPGSNDTGFKHNSARGTSHVFGSDVLEKFLDDMGLDLIVRAHEVVEDGYRFFGSERRSQLLVTIFTAPNYTAEYSNAAAVLR
jgi:serine/threonine-protein phosphatase PP1 catalytic subunit